VAFLTFEQHFLMFFRRNPLLVYLALKSEKEKNLTIKLLMFKRLQIKKWLNLKKKQVLNYPDRKIKKKTDKKSVLFLV